MKMRIALAMTSIPFILLFGDVGDLKAPPRASGTSQQTVQLKLEGDLPATLRLRRRPSRLDSASLPNMGPRMPSTVAPSARAWGGCKANDERWLMTDGS